MGSRAPLFLTLTLATRQPTGWGGKDRSESLVMGRAGVKQVLAVASHSRPATAGTERQQREGKPAFSQHSPSRLCPDKVLPSGSTLSQAHGP